MLAAPAQVPVSSRSSHTPCDATPAPAHFAKHADAYVRPSVPQTGAHSCRQLAQGLGQVPLSAMVTLWQCARHALSYVVPSAPHTASWGVQETAGVTVF